MRTDWSKRSDPVAYQNLDDTGQHTPGPDPGCVRFLVNERDVLGFGTETIGTDAGQAAHFSPPYPCHYYMHGAGKYGLQCLCNLDRLPPTGALIGLDAVRAAAEGEIRSIKMITRKPPAGLEGAPYLLANNIAVAGLTQPLKVFDGTAREGARGFPANVNVAAALSLAGIGPDRTRLEIWADPTITRNTHRIEVDADVARFSMTIEGVPSENPRTGRIVPLSTVAALRALVSELKVGT